jgi:hypothetical protein
MNFAHYRTCAILFICRAFQGQNAMDGLLLDVTHPDSLQKWLLVCAGGLTIFYAVWRPMRRKKDPLKKPPTMSLAGQREVERQLTELIVELEKMARQMTAQMDTRAAKLEMLIEEADVRLAALKAAGVSGVVTRPAESVKEISEAHDSRYDSIYDLAAQGQSARQIAQQLNRPYGEIELILALHGQNRPASHLLAS